MRKILLLLCIFNCVFCFSQKEIPDVSLFTLKGNSVKIREVIPRDKITVLSFWATWCIPCITELDAIDDVYQDWKRDTGVNLIAISTDDPKTQNRVKSLVDGKGWEYKVLIDKDQKLKRRLNISVIPHILVLKGNKILYRRTGYSLGSEDELYEIIKKNK